MTEKKIAVVKNEHIGKLAFEMRLNKWLIVSKHAESKSTRTNLKKLGCLFEAFIGALFLDFNKIDVADEHNWFRDVFPTGPGFQMAQVFIENVFEQHIDWVSLIKTNDNFKNILQVRIQKEFKTTPDYLELDRDPEGGYTMGVYLRLGAALHIATEDMERLDFKTDFGSSFARIQERFSKGEALFIHLGTGSHRVKRKAEQIACESAIELMDQLWTKRLRLVQFFFFYFLRLRCTRLPTLSQVIPRCWCLDCPNINSYMPDLSFSSHEPPF
jgi:dsRNA-specific ribonuclease